MKPLKIRLYTVIFVFRGDQILLLKRAPWKEFGANKFTGIGGKIEPHELSDIFVSALREFGEETKIKKSKLKNPKYLGVLSFSEAHQGEGHTYFFSVDVGRNENLDLSCTEGELDWYDIDQIQGLDIWEDTKAAIPFLFKVRETGRIFRGNYIFGKRRNRFSYLLE